MSTSGGVAVLAIATAGGCVATAGPAVEGGLPGSCEIEFVVPALLDALSGLYEADPASGQLILHPRPAARPGQEDTAAVHSCDLGEVAEAIGARIDSSAPTTSCVDWGPSCRVASGQAIVTFGIPERGAGDRTSVVVDLIYHSSHVRGGLARLTTEYRLVRESGGWRIVDEIGLRVR